MSKVNFLESYAPAEAERGKFVPVDGQTLDTNYPLSGRGKFALLTYSVGSNSVNPSGTRNPIIPNEINERNEGNGLNNN